MKETIFVEAPNRMNEVSKLYLVSEFFGSETGNADASCGIQRRINSRHFYIQVYVQNYENKISENHVNGI